MRSFVTRLLVGCLIAALAACSRAPETEPTAATVLRLTAEPPPTATPRATAAAYPTVTPHIFCEGAPESFLIIGERGRVTLTEDGKWLNLRAGPGTENDVITQLAPLEEFLVLDGVRCDGPYAWYQIDFRGRVGWIAEGFEGQYYAEPWLTG